MHKQRYICWILNCVKDQFVNIVNETVERKRLICNFVIFSFLFCFYFIIIFTSGLTWDSAEQTLS